MSLIDCGSDYGAYVRGAIESGLEGGAEVLACPQEITMPEFAEIWGQGESPRPALLRSGRQSYDPRVILSAMATGTTLTDHYCYLVRPTDYFCFTPSGPSFLRLIVNGVKATYYPMPADQFKVVAGEEITEMMGWFSDFGCESEQHVHAFLAFVQYHLQLHPCRPLTRPRRPGYSVNSIRLRWQGDRMVPKGLARRRQGEHLEDFCRGSGLVQGARLICRHVPLIWNAEWSD